MFRRLAVRNSLLRWLILAVIAVAFGVLAAACGKSASNTPVPTQPPKVVKQTVLVTQPAIKETQVVKQTQVVTATATAVPLATPTAVPAPAPNPKNAAGDITVAITTVPAGIGVGSDGAPVEDMQYWGVGEGLFAVDAKGDVIPKLAESYTLAPDLSSVTIKLRQDVVFQKGFGPFTAADVVYTLNDANANTNPTSIHGQAGDFAALFGKAVEVDKYTVKIPFVHYDLRWDGNFLNEQAQGTAFFSKNAFDTKGKNWMDSHIVSTGPFQVDQWIENDHATLSPVPYKHWYHNAAIKQLKFIQVPDPESRVSMLKTGEADVTDSLNFKDIKPLTAGGFVAANITRRGAVHEIIFDGNYWETKDPTTGKPLDRPGYCVNNLPWVYCNTGKFPKSQQSSKDVRTALAYAIDRSSLVKNVLYGFGVPASIEYVDTTASYYQKKWDIPYDPQQAKSLMSQSTWPNGNFQIGIWTGGEDGGGHGTNGDLNDAIAGMWHQLWPKMDIQVFKSSYSIIRPSLVGRSNTIPYGGDCDEGATTIPFDWPHGLTETALTRGGFGCGIEIPMIQSTYLKVNKEQDIAKRIQLNNALIDYLHAQNILVGTVQIPQLVVYNPKSIAKWPGTPSIFADMDNFAFIEPATR